ncbi:XdhC family protein [Ramlibacter sp. AW1]|uniref:XdhC family protein n=1 Tax=Ramlibacter aurantiacus TaxID=2801330 RepID=A0A936ZWE5_9BURK|nr:XdhC family protein [Ramlibacter aurantiacus]MBL0422355.1 XdhC family protein [Ramlibacter aurantiacus]
MENLDVMVLRTLRDWRAAGQSALLATVVRTWGSSPRPVGSIMALRADGAVMGSVSGGCIEDDLIERYRGAIAHEPPRLVRYGVSADEAHRFGLPCGGTLELLLEFQPDAGSLAELVRVLESGRLVRRHTRLADGRVDLEPAEVPSDLRLDDKELVNHFGPEWRMLLIGAGQISEYLATMALFSGFAVTVCDPREEYRGSWQVPGARLVTGMPDDVVAGFGADARSCVIALTHDPKLDDLALIDALETDAFYIGAIGSRRNDAARRQRLVEHFGQTPASLARLRGPIGLYIGSKTPPEIAVSVMAEVLAVKNGVVLPAQMQVAEGKELHAQSRG